jgi:kumamolisin
VGDGGAVDPAADPAAAPAAAPASFTPPQIAGLYQFPAGTDGTGQRIAILELGGGFGPSDLDAYFSGLGITAPSVTAAGVDGAVNQPGQDPGGDDGEVLLDIEVAGAIAPGAPQTVYFAPNTDRGFVDAVSAAVHATPTPTVISISWGQSEDSWTAQARSALDAAIADAAALGVTVCAAAGDSGSTDTVSDGANHADFPASSPHVLACGGTSLQGNPATGAITSEVVWNDGPGRGSTGGGVSDVFPLPSWQAAAGVPVRAGTGATSGRGVPDVAGNADPATGYQVLVDGQRMVVGGTSAVAPLWAALVSRLAQAKGGSFGLLQPWLYAGVTAGTAAAGFRDITSGSNGAYAAGPGWDACTGLGSPVGTTLLTRLSQAG